MTEFDFRITVMRLFQKLKISQSETKLIKRCLDGLIIFYVLLFLITRYLGIQQVDFAGYILSLHRLYTFSIFAVIVFLRLLIGRQFNILLSLFSLAVVLYAFELVLAVTDHFSMKKTAVQGSGLRNDSEWTWGHKIVNNRYGFREREFEMPKPRGVYRIMVLGDSLTWGAGLDIGQRYTERLEQMLRKSFPDRDIEVLNFGVQGGPTVLERNILYNTFDMVQPDLIILGFCINDPQPKAENYSVERERMNRVYGMIAGARHIGLKRAYKFTINGIDNFLIKKGIIPSFRDALDRVYEKSSHQWKEFVRALNDIRGISEKKGLPGPIFVLLTQIIAKDHPDDPYVTKWMHQAGDAALEAGFVVVDPENVFIEKVYSWEIPVNPLDGHPSAKCNDIYAEELFKAACPLVGKSFE